MEVCKERRGVRKERTAVIMLGLGFCAVVFYAWTRPGQRDNADHSVVL